MPATPISVSPSLDIELDGGPAGVYRPGDTITGRVVRASPIVTPEAAVTILLYGRSKSKSVRYDTNNNTTDIYRGQYVLIDAKDNVQKLFTGVLHVPPNLGEKKAWPFAIKIPQHVSPSVVHPGAHQHSSFLPLDRQTLKWEPLPPSFNEVSTSGAKAALIEYVLQAQIRYRSRGSWDELTAMLPITIVTTYQGPPLYDPPNMVVYAVRLAIASQRLLPGMHHASLSASQKMKKWLSTTSVPRYGFKLQIGLPDTIQIEGNSHIPMQVRIVPDMDRTSEEIRNVRQSTTLTHLVVSLECHREVHVDTSISQEGARWKSENILLTGHDLKLLPKDFEIPCTEALPPVDLGKALKFRLPLHRAAGKGFSGFQEPAFTTYNLRVGHRLLYTLEFDISGEPARWEGMSDVKVLPPSHLPSSWLGAQSIGTRRPPGVDVEPPPPFEQVQKGDKSFARKKDGKNIVVDQKRRWRS